MSPGLAGATLWDMAEAVGDYKGWHKRAACLEVSFDFYPDERIPTEVEKRKAVCRTCPVRWVCLADGFLAGQDEGVWGGMLASKFNVFFAMLGELPKPLSVESLADFLQQRIGEASK